MLTLKHTPVYRKFKDNIGHTNHYLITILIGLEGVRNGKVTQDPSFNAKWNPQNLESSVQRSRRFARSAGLAWGVDAVDGYLGYLNKAPFDFSTTAHAEALQKRSVYERFSSIVGSLGNHKEIEFSLTHLAIQWRNNLIHYHAENLVDDEVWKRLKAASKSKLGKEYGGLDLSETLSRFKSHETPTFKDVASMISAMRRSVQAIDLYAIDYFDAVQFANRSIILDSNFRKKLSESLSEKREKKMVVYLKSLGFVDAPADGKCMIQKPFMADLVKVALSKNNEPNKAVEATPDGAPHL